MPLLFRNIHSHLENLVPEIYGKIIDERCCKHILKRLAVCSDLGLSDSVVNIIFLGKQGKEPMRKWDEEETKEDEDSDVEVRKRQNWPETDDDWAALYGDMSAPKNSNRSRSRSHTPRSRSRSISLDRSRSRS